MTAHYDVAVVGGGIVGLAHAWMATLRGLRVALFERTPDARGASIRNFGMIWPIGQPPGSLYELALRSRARWLELQRRQVLDVEACGSIHLAYRDDELAVLREFCDADDVPEGVEMIGPAEVLRRSNLVKPDGLLGGMYSSAELRVDPRTASARIASWLATEHAVDVHFATPIMRVEGRCLTDSGGRRWTADRTIICSGSDLKTLYPAVLARSGLRLCKLQMLRAAAQSDRQPISPHLASGLTLRHYASFRNCPGHDALCRRIAAETPELDRYGIHVMASQAADGEVILGDSHEYDEAITPFDKAEIDELILRELRGLLRLENWTITQRWHGVYAKHPERPIFEQQVDDGVWVFVGPGGAGMTLAFGLAERAWQQWQPQDESQHATA
jgi:FAD dependent oxidoreductase TIGR03364